MELLEKLNTKPMQKLEKSRREMFINCDRPNALALPKKQFEFSSWKKAKVNIDYHIEIDKNYYSVPYRFLHQTVDVRLTKNVVEKYLKMKQE